jgi:hypothetical protein
MQYLNIRIAQGESPEKAIQNIEDGSFINWHIMSDIVRPIDGLNQAVSHLYKLLDARLNDYLHTKYQDDIEETLDMVLVLYFGEAPDGDRQCEIADNMDNINVLDAIEMLSNRLASLPDVQDDVLINKLRKRGYLVDNLFHESDIESEHKERVKKYLHKNFDANEGINWNTIRIANENS